MTSSPIPPTPPLCASRPKPALSSLSVQGSIVGLVGILAPVLLRIFGVPAGELDTDASAFVAVAGCITAIVGRIVATRRIG